MFKTLIAAALVMAAPAYAEKLNLKIAGEANGIIVIDLNEAGAPQHVARIKQLAEEGAYDGVAFHRVITGFMAQTGDVQFGKVGGDMSMAGMGGSSYPDLPAEFTDAPFERGTVGMARAMDPNSANSQFFIMFDAQPHLNGQYTVVGTVLEGLEVLDAIKRGDEAANGAITGAPDYIETATISD